MQYQKVQRGVRCPNCNDEMQGCSISYHYYRCPNCETELNGLGIIATQGFEWVIGVICLVGLIVLFFDSLK